MNKQTKETVMFSIRVIVLISIFTSAVFGNTTTKDPEALAGDALYGECLPYIQSLDSIDQISAADKEMWVGRFEQAIDDWSDPGRLFGARNVVIALHNARQDWDLSLAAIDDAIASTNNDQYLFEWQYDRWTVLHRVDQQEGSEPADGDKPVGSIKAARDTAINTFESLYNKTDGDGRQLNGVANFIALSFDALQDKSLNTEQRIKTGKLLIDVARVYQIQNSISQPAIANYAGHVAGLLVQKNPVRAAKIVESIDGDRDQLIAVVLAMQVAREESTPSVEINQFLWEVRDQFKEDADWLNISVRHIQNVFQSARQNRIELVTGIAAEQLDGVPSIDLLNMIEPSVSQMLADGYGQIIRTRQSQRAKEAFAILQTGIHTLADLLELMGEHNNAEAYRAQTNPEKMKFLIE